MDSASHLGEEEEARGGSTCSCRSSPPLRCRRCSRETSNPRRSQQEGSQADPSGGNRLQSSITVSVTPTTGGQFDLSVLKSDSIENLKKLISKRLKVPKERICLLHRERQLREGTIQENQIVNGSRLTLLPSVETGLLAQRPEQSVMQALESLNDSQVNDFLSGKAPLNLTMRLGDHMMLIQLQLSTVAPSGGSGGSGTSSSSRKSKSGMSSSLSNSSSSSISSPFTSTSLSSKRKESPITSSSTSSSQSSSSSAVSNTSSSSSPCLHNHLNSSGQQGSLTPASQTLGDEDDDCHCGGVANGTAGGGGVNCLGATGSSIGNSSSMGGGSSRPVLDTKALAEASRNLTQTLKQLSSEVLTSKGDPIEEGTNPKRRQGAIIESMHHHGKGVYSGTFSGTLNPALQDRFGRPKRDISTIIHILNDLLCATPQYRGGSVSLSGSQRGDSLTSGKSSGSSSVGRMHFHSSHSSNSEGNSTGNGGGTGGRGSGGGESSTPSTRGSSLALHPPRGEGSLSQESSNSSSPSPSQEPLLIEESVENQATRGKMERLRLVLGQRRERRRAMRSAPYSTNHDHVTA